MIRVGVEHKWPYFYKQHCNYPVQSSADRFFLNTNHERLEGDNRMNEVRQTVEPLLTYQRCPSTWFLFLCIRTMSSLHWAHRSVSASRDRRWSHWIKLIRGPRCRSINSFRFMTSQLRERDSQSTRSSTNTLLEQLFWGSSSAQDLRNSQVTKKQRTQIRNKDLNTVRNRKTIAPKESKKFSHLVLYHLLTYSLKLQSK